MTTETTKQLRTTEQQAKLDDLSTLIGRESNITDTLADVNAELAKLRAATAPLEVRRSELLTTLESIELAKAEAVKIKSQN